MAITICDMCAKRKICIDKNKFYPVVKCQNYHEGEAIEVEQTNEEWRKTCSAEDFAYWLADVCAWAMEEFRCGNTEKSNIDYWEKWLKEKHNGV